MDQGILYASKQAPRDPMPTSWLGKPDAPMSRPDWAAIPPLTSVQQKSLLAQIAYSFSRWDYTKIGSNKELGRYQFGAQLLESYGLLTPGSYASYGTEAVTYQHCWRQQNGTYSEYLSDVDSLQSFLTNRIAQESLANQRLLDLYNTCVKTGVIKVTDSIDIIIGMLYTAWVLGTGSQPTKTNPAGTGAYSWRHYNVGEGTEHYNLGRYSTVVLSNSDAIKPVPTKVDVQTTTATPEIKLAQSLPSLGSLTTGTTNGSILNQQLQASAVNLAGSVTSSVANGVISRLATGIGENSGAIVNLAAATIQNPQALVATATNMATDYAMQQVGNWLPLTNNKIQGYVIDNLDNAIGAAFGDVSSDILFIGNVQF